MQTWDLQPVRVMAIQSPALDPIANKVCRGTYTASSALETQDGYTDKVKSKPGVLNRKRAELRAHDRAVDQLNKGWNKAVKTCNDPGSDIDEALNGITIEPTTPAPKTIEIHSITQGGDFGLQVLVAYTPGGGGHATTKLVIWQVVGVDADFTHNTPIDPSGKALGPFTVSQTVKVITEALNGIATPTPAPRTIVIGEPVV